MSADMVNAQTAVTAPVGTDAVAVAGGSVRGVLAEVRAVLGLRGAVTGLLSGSWVLAGMGCGCVGHALRWAWEQASVDPDAQDAVTAHAAKIAAAKAVEGEEERAEALAAVGKGPSGRRPFLEALAYLVLGGMLAAGAAGTAGALIAPHLGALAEWKPVILSAGVAGWMAAAWMVAPSPAAPAGDVVVDGDDVQADTDAEDLEEARGTALLWHVLRALADAETAGRAGLHLDAVLDSATDAGLLPQDTELPAFRAWVESTGLPTVDKLGMRIGGKPVTRVGLRVDGATKALGMPPTALLAARSQPPAGGAPTAPARPVEETPLNTPVETAADTPVEVPVEVPVPAVLRLIPGGRQHPDPTPSPTLSKGPAQEAR